MFPAIGAKQTDAAPRDRKKPGRVLESRSKSTDPAYELHRKDALKQEKARLQKERRAKSRIDEEPLSPSRPKRNSGNAVPRRRGLPVEREPNPKLMDALKEMKPERPGWNDQTVLPKKTRKQQVVTPVELPPIDQAEWEAPDELYEPTSPKSPKRPVVRRRRKEAPTKQGGHVVDTTPGMRAANVQKVKRRNSQVLLGEGYLQRGAGDAQKLLQQAGEWHPLLIELQRQAARHLTICEGELRERERLDKTIELLRVMNAVLMLKDAIDSRNLDDLLEALDAAMECSGVALDPVNGVYEGENTDLMLLVEEASRVTRILRAQAALVRATNAPGERGDDLRLAIAEADEAGGDAANGVQIHQAKQALAHIDELLLSLETLIALFDADALDTAVESARELPDGVIPELLLTSAAARALELHAMNARRQAAEEELIGAIEKPTRPPTRLEAAIEEGVEAGADPQLVDQAKTLLARLNAEQSLREAIELREIPALIEAIEQADEADEKSQGLHHEDSPESMDDYLEMTAGLVDPQLRAEAEALLEQLQLLAEEKGVVEDALKAALEAGTIEALALAIELAIANGTVDPELLARAEAMLNGLEKVEWAKEMRKALFEEDVGMIEALLKRGQREGWDRHENSVAQEAMSFLNELTRVEMTVNFEEEGHTGMWGTEGWFCNPQWRIKTVDGAAVAGLKVWVTMTPLAHPLGKFGLHVVRNQGELLSKTCPTAAAGCEVVGTHRPAWRGGRYAPIISTSALDLLMDGGDDAVPYLLVPSGEPGAGEFKITVLSKQPMEAIPVAVPWKWSMHLDGRWAKSDGTAGGKRGGKTGTWYKNPQFRLFVLSKNTVTAVVVVKPEEGSEPGVGVHVVQNKKCMTYSEIAAVIPKSQYHAMVPGGSVLKDYSNASDACVCVELSKGDFPFFAVPSTWEAGREGKFSLQIVATEELLVERVSGEGESGSRK